MRQVLPVGTFSIFTDFQTKRLLVGFMPIDARGVGIHERDVELETPPVVCGYSFGVRWAFSKPSWYLVFHGQLVDFHHCRNDENTPW